MSECAGKKRVDGTVQRSEERKLSEVSARSLAPSTLLFTRLTTHLLLTCGFAVRRRRCLRRHVVDWGKREERLKAGGRGGGGGGGSRRSKARSLSRQLPLPSSASSERAKQMRGRKLHA